MQGAGGVGGLLSESNISNPQSPISYPTYDGNGNISEYLTATGTIAAHFEYDAFGNTTINTDTTNQFTYKFSTKPQDVETGLYYYGYRYYDAVMGRWINRDPINEQGGLNIYSLFKNDIIRYADFLGLFAGAPPPLAPLLPVLPTFPITIPTPAGVAGGFVTLPAIGVGILAGITVGAGVIALQELEAAIEAQRRLDEARRQSERLRDRILCKFDGFIEMIGPGSDGGTCGYRCTDGDYPEIPRKCAKDCPYQDGTVLKSIIERTI